MRTHAGTGRARRRAFGTWPPARRARQGPTSEMPDAVLAPDDARRSIGEALLAAITRRSPDPPLSYPPRTPQSPFTLRYRRSGDGTQECGAADRARPIEKAGSPARRRSGLGFGPVVADSDIDGERRVERVRAAHLLADELAHGRDLRLRHVEQELVVHLEHQPSTSALTP